MATLFYLPSSGAGDVAPTAVITGEWTLHQNNANRKMVLARINSALTSLAYNPDGADHLVDGNSLVVQYVSQILPPQTVAAQQIAVGFRCLEVAASNNLFPCWKLYGVDVAGSSNLGTLVAFFRSALAEVGTALTGYCEAKAGSAITYAVPWRLVLELGLGGLPVNTATDTHNGTIELGDPLATGALNLPQQADTTACTPCLLFSNDLITSFGGSRAQYMLGK